MNPLRRRSFKLSNGLVYSIRWFRTDDSDISYLKRQIMDLEADQSNDSKEEKRDLRRRIASFKTGGWYMTTAVAEIYYRHNGVKTVLGRASLDQVESDAGYSYFSRVEQDLFAEAERGVEEIRRTLKIQPIGETHVYVSRSPGQDLPYCA
jgi:hypothetical protein